MNKIDLVFSSNDELIHILKNLNEKELISEIKSFGWLIKYINKPSYKVKLYSVKQDPYNIRYIHDPSEEIQLIAVRNFNNYNNDYNDQIVKDYIKSTKALELYEKIKKVKGIIK